jgi:hypothetical protein
VLFTASEIEKIDGTCRLAMSSGKSTKQWHASELLGKLRASAPTLAKRLDAYSLSACLLIGGKLQYLGRQIWVSDSNADSRQRDRAEISQVLVRVLIDSGRPLRKDALVKRASAVRGLVGKIQLNANGEMTMIRPGFWGLVRRDLPWSDRQRSGLLEDLVRFLSRARGSVEPAAAFVFVARKKKNVRDAGLDAVIGLARSDARIQFDKHGQMRLRPPTA